MRCIECGNHTEAHREERLLQLDLPYDVVVTDAPVYVCPHCGERYEGLQGAAPLMATLARWVAKRSGRLQPAELRFLRNASNWSQDDLGQRLGVAIETISRWENGKKPIGYQSELAFRMTVLTGDNIAARLQEVSDPPDRLDISDHDIRIAAAS